METNDLEQILIFILEDFARRSQLELRQNGNIYELYNDKLKIVVTFGIIITFKISVPKKFDSLERARELCQSVNKDTIGYFVVDGPRETINYHHTLMDISFDTFNNFLQSSWESFRAHIIAFDSDNSLQLAFQRKNLLKKITDNLKKSGEILEVEEDNLIVFKRDFSEKNFIIHTKVQGDLLLILCSTNERVLLRETFEFTCFAVNDSFSFDVGNFIFEPSSRLLFFQTAVPIFLLPFTSERLLETLNFLLRLNMSQYFYRLPQMQKIKNSRASYQKSLETKESSSFSIDPLQVSIGDQIGQGGMGNVYRGRYVNVNVVLKELRIDKLSQSDDFLEEIRIHKECSNNFIVSVIGAFRVPSETNKNIMMVQEYCSRGSLDKLLEEERKKLIHLEESIKMKSAREIASGMAFLHAKGIIHLDLKPQNIMVTDDFHFKVGDFGLAKYLVDTYINVIGGTIPYLAPECLNRRKGSKYADVYAYGIVLFELFTLSLPYDFSAFESTVSFMNAIINGYRPVFPLNVPIRPEIKNLIIRCWAQEPTERPGFDAIVLELTNIFWLQTNENYHPIIPPTPRTPPNQIMPSSLSIPHAPVNATASSPPSGSASSSPPMSSSLSSLDIKEGECWTMNPGIPGGWIQKYFILQNREIKSRLDFSMSTSIMGTVEPISFPLSSQTKLTVKNKQITLVNTAKILILKLENENQFREWKQAIENAINSC